MWTTQQPTDGNNEPTALSLLKRDVRLLFRAIGTIY